LSIHSLPKFNKIVGYLSPTAPPNEYRQIIEMKM